MNTTTGTTRATFPTDPLKAASDLVCKLEGFDIEAAVIRSVLHDVSADLDQVTGGRPMDIDAARSIVEGTWAARILLLGALRRLEEELRGLSDRAAALSDAVHQRGGNA